MEISLLDELCAELGLTRDALSVRCSPARGCFICWLLRAMLSNHVAVSTLTPKDLTYLQDFFTDLVTGRPSWAEAKSQALERGQLDFPTDHLIRLSRIASRGNPYRVELI